MSNQNNQEIFSTESGIVNVEYYRLEASRLRSEYLLTLFKRAQTSLKKLFGSNKVSNESAIDIFTIEKLAR